MCCVDSNQAFPIQKYLFIQTNTESTSMSISNSYLS